MDYRRIIPCLDTKNGRLVKGINFVDLKELGDQAEAGAAYSKAGADGRVFLDITIDTRSNPALPSGFEMVVSGGTRATGHDAVEWAQEAVSRGDGALLPTSMVADGTQAGYDIPMTRAIAEGHDDGVLVASIAHYGTFTIRQMKE